MTGSGQETSRKRRRRGFERASSLVAARVRNASESHGFAVTRLLTHWAEVVGPDIAAVARPVEIKYGRGFGATLTLLTTGAEAPMLEMQKEKIRERVNACYGYSAVQKIRLTQTSATGFSEGQAMFMPAPVPEPPTEPAVTPEAARTTSGINDPNLRDALARLATKILSQNKQQ